MKLNKKWTETQALFYIKLNKKWTEKQFFFLSIRKFFYRSESPKRHLFRYVRRPANQFSIPNLEPSLSIHGTTMKKKPVPIIIIIIISWMKLNGFEQLATPSLTQPPPGNDSKCKIAFHPCLCLGHVPPTRKEKTLLWTIKDSGLNSLCFFYIIIIIMSNYFSQIEFIFF